MGGPDNIIILVLVLYSLVSAILLDRYHRRIKELKKIDKK
jgi:positive regulator of sigma E activity